MLFDFFLHILYKRQLFSEPYQTYKPLQQKILDKMIFLANNFLSMTNNMNFSQ